MEQPTAVIVEDELLFVQALTAFVEDLGYRVLATTDTEQSAIDVVHACSACRRHRPPTLAGVQKAGGRKARRMDGAAPTID